MMCPGCGAPMSLDAGKDFLACEYCGTTHFPDPNPDGVRVLDEPSDEKCPRCSVALVQAAIAGGNYKVSAEDVANSLMDHMLGGKE